MNFEAGNSSYVTPQDRVTEAEKYASLFQPDTLLAAEYFDDRRGQTFLEPEKKLMLAVMEDAINCFQDNHSARFGKRKQLFDEAQQWIFAVSDGIFSFENICHALDFDPEYVRKGLLRWCDKQSSKKCPKPLRKGSILHHETHRQIGEPSASAHDRHFTIIRGGELT